VGNSGKFAGRRFRARTIGAVIVAGGNRSAIIWKNLPPRKKKGCSGRFPLSLRRYRGREREGRFSVLDEKAFRNRCSRLSLPRPTCAAFAKRQRDKCSGHGGRGPIASCVSISPRVAIAINCRLDRASLLEGQGSLIATRGPERLVAWGGASKKRTKEGTAA